MKFTTIFAVLAAAAATVGAAPAETNGDRLARGLPPLPPARRATHVGSARRSKPSGSPGGGGNCNTGPVQCCNSVTTANDKVASLLIGLLNIVVGPEVAVGMGCSPLSVIGVGGNSCNSQPVCCENNKFNGLIVIGCSPININA